MINIMCVKILFEINVLLIVVFSLVMVKKSYNFFENYLSYILSSLVYILLF